MCDKEKYELEFLINTSKRILYNRLSTPSGLSEWFADDVNIRNDVFTFFWNGDEDKARLVGKRRDEYVRFQWLREEEEENDCYFEMRIKVDPITGDTALLITDYADDEEEVEENSQLWEKQVDALKRILGS